MPSRRSPSARKGHLPWWAKKSASVYSSNSEASPKQVRPTGRIYRKNRSGGELEAEQSSPKSKSPKSCKKVTAPKRNTQSSPKTSPRSSSNDPPKKKRRLPASPRASSSRFSEGGDSPSRSEEDSAPRRIPRTYKTVKPSLDGKGLKAKKTVTASGLRRAAHGLGKIVHLRNISRPPTEDKTILPKNDPIFAIKNRRGQPNLKKAFNAWGATDNGELLQMNGETSPSGSSESDARSGTEDEQLLGPAIANANSPQLHGALAKREKVRLNRDFGLFLELDNSSGAEVYEQHIVDIFNHPETHWPTAAAAGAPSSYALPRTSLAPLDLSGGVPSTHLEISRNPGNYLFFELTRVVDDRTERKMESGLHTSLYQLSLYEMRAGVWLTAIDVELWESSTLPTGEPGTGISGGRGAGTKGSNAAQVRLLIRKHWGLERVKDFTKNRAVTGVSVRNTGGPPSSPDLDAVNLLSSSCSPKTVEKNLGNALTLIGNSASRKPLKFDFRFATCQKYLYKLVIRPSLRDTRGEVMVRPLCVMVMWGK